MDDAALSCVCGSKIDSADDLKKVEENEGEIVFRCRNNSACRLEEVCRIRPAEGDFEVLYSPMFSDWNLLHLGRERLLSELRRLAYKIVKETIREGNVLRIRVKIMGR
ncbi:MAG: hypothetical protein NXY59_03655 [Aigarchaeota archaeon]|nr:hypothetical protein [Candidatus Pelearchaeum maunauluense]